MKIYKSNTGLAISVTLENGRNRYVSFDSISDGTAYCYVTDKRLMKAIEEHPYFGTNISVYYNDEQEEATANAAGTGAAKKGAKKAKGETISAEGADLGTGMQPISADQPAANAAGTVADEVPAEGDGSPAGEQAMTAAEVAEEPKEVEVMKFECFDDARDYLNETYGVAKKRLMSKVMVIAEGEALGIKIEFND